MAELAPHDKDALHEAYVAQVNVLFGLLCQGLAANWSDRDGREMVRTRFLIGVHIAREAHGIASDAFAQPSKGLDDDQK